MFWKTLNWIQDNWKSIALLGIPVLISFIAGLVRKNKSLENKVKMKEKETEITREAAELEATKREEARVQKEELITAAEMTHDAMISQVKEGMAKRIDEIETAEQATEAIKEVIDQSVFAYPDPKDVKPPRFPNPRTVKKLRPCPCGSRETYWKCCAVNWSKN